MKDKESKIIMISEQLIARGIKNKNIIDAFKSVSRKNFVKPIHNKKAYSDYPLDIGFAQTISQPYIVARMLELLEIDKDKNVLEIGTGSGYQTALLSLLAKQVYTIERIPELLDFAKGNLTDYKNIKFLLGDGTFGHEEYAPYDRIIISASAPSTPPPLIDQLNQKSGILVMPCGDEFTQRLTVIKIKDSCLSTDYYNKCIFVKLIGKGWGVNPA